MEQADAVGLPYNQHAKGCSYREDPEDCDCECPPVPEPKFCKDCKWVRRVWADLGTYNTAECEHPSSANNHSLVTGRGGCRCSVMRVLDITGCGADGKYWEAK